MLDFPHVSPERRAEIESYLMRGHSMSAIIEALSQEEQKEIEKIEYQEKNNPVYTGVVPEKETNDTEGDNFYQEISL